MTNPETLTISCDGPARIMGAMDALMPQLDRDIRDKFNLIKLRYWQLYGFQGLFERVNNRTVAQVISEFDFGSVPPPIASGEMDGVRYELYDAPASHSMKEDTAQ